MASSNAIVVVVSEWLPRDEWAAAPDRTRRRFLARLAPMLVDLKRGEMLDGVGADGKDFTPVLPRRGKYRHATGKPLDPFRDASRSVRLLRASVGHRAGTVTLHWSHGWAAIMGYHRDGIRRRDMPGGRVRRDAIGLTRAGLAKARAEALRLWRATTAPKPAKKAAPPRQPPTLLDARPTTTTPAPAPARGPFASAWHKVKAWRGK